MFGRRTGITTELDPGHRPTVRRSDGRRGPVGQTRPLRSEARHSEAADGQARASARPADATGRTRPAWPEQAVRFGRKSFCNNDIIVESHTVQLVLRALSPPRLRFQWLG